MRIRNDEPAYVEPPPYLSGTSKRVVRRDGRLFLDNGLCKGAQSLVYFSGRGPMRTANCKPNEVEVPDVVGQRIDIAQARLAAQPLGVVIAYQPASSSSASTTSSRRCGRAASSYDNLTLIISKSTARDRCRSSSG